MVIVAIANFHSGPQRRSSPPVGLIHGGAVVEQESGNVELGVGYGHQQRRDSVCFCQVHIGLTRYQELYRLETTVTRRIQQRSHGSRGRVLNTALWPATPHDAESMGAATRSASIERKASRR